MMSSKNKAILLGIGAVVILAGVIAFFMLPSEAPTTQDGELATPTVVVTRTADGYEPKEVTIKVGDTVQWVNESGEYHWPASDLHPTHGVYPEFDPMTPVAPDDAWQFIFTQTGEWRYHDHIRANKTGTVTVTE